MDPALAALAYMAIVAWVFMQTLKTTRSMSRAFIATLLVADLAALAMLFLGIDRPVARVCTRIGCTTVTAMEIFLALKVPVTLYSIAKQGKLRQLLDA